MQLQSKRIETKHITPLSPWRGVGGEAGSGGGPGSGGEASCGGEASWV